MYVEIVSTVSPCALVCQSAETSQRVLRSNTVTDGTPCYSGTFDHAVCIEGRCTVSCSYLIEIVLYTLSIKQDTCICIHILIYVQ